MLLKKCFAASCSVSWLRRREERASRVARRIRAAVYPAGALANSTTKKVLKARRGVSRPDEERLVRRAARSATQAALQIARKR